MQWGWVEGAHFSGDPQLVGDAIERLARKLGRPHDAIVADDIVREAADDEQSPFRRFFPWDDAVAAHQRRLEIARGILRSCRPIVIVEAGPKMVMGRVSVRIEGGERAYVLMDKVARTEALNVQAVAAARAGLQAWRSRYEQIAGFDKVLGWIDRAIAEIEQKEKALARAAGKKKVERAPAQV